MIKAAIFDMDGLLIDSEPLWFPALQSAYKTVGIDFTREMHQSMLGLGLQAVVENMYREHPWQGPSRKDIEALIVDDLLAEFKKRGKLMPGAQETMEICKNAGLKLAIASSSYYEIIDTVVDKLQIRNYFDVIYSAEHEEYAKPHPGVFITAAKKLETGPEQCIVFEDAPAGVLAAKAAKMKCIAVPRKAHMEDKFIKTADLVLSSLKDFNEQSLADL